MTIGETGLTSSDFTLAGEPLKLFAEWLEDATKSEINDPNAMALATVDPRFWSVTASAYQRGWQQFSSRRPFILEFRA